MIGSTQLYQAYREGDWVGMLFAVPLLLGAGRGQCFVAGTRVATGTNPDGSLSFTRIESIQVGDMVLTRGDLDGTLVGRRVTARWAETTGHVRTLAVRLADGSVETIGTTDGHPFAVAGDGWREAGSLALGTRLVLSDGRTGTLVESTRADLPAGVTVYNLEVEGGHSYFVADGRGDDTQGVWVHNAKKYGFANSGGRRGSPSHIARVNLAELSLTTLRKNKLVHLSGGTLPEKAYRTPAGKIRFPDMVFSSKRGLIAVQVGKALKSNLPVSRERAAIADLKLTNKFAHIFFIKY